MTTGKEDRAAFPPVGDAPLTAEEERDLARRVAAGDPEARDRLARANLRLVVKIARRFAGKGVPLADLIAEGSLGLLRAVEGFDPDLGHRFSTYAGWWVLQSVRAAMHPPGRVARLPRRVAALVARWRRATAELREEFGRTPEPAEVAARLGLTRGQFRAVTSALPVCHGQAGTAADGSNWLAGEVADGRSAAPDDQVSGAEESRRLSDALDRLGGRGAAVLRMRYGLGGEPPRTLQEVGDLLGCSRERARQIEAAALAELRRLLGNG